MKGTGGFLLATLLLLSCSWAQERPALTASPNTIFVSSEGRFAASPDTAVLEFNISAQNQSARLAYDQAAREAEQVRQILRSNLIEPKMASIGYYRLQPVYDYKASRQKIVGYEVRASVSLRLKDFTKVAALTEQLGASQVDDQSVSYILEDMDAAKTKAVEDAYRRARESALALARAAERGLGPISYAALDTEDNVRPVRLMARAMPSAAPLEAPAPNAEFSPQEVTVTAHLSAVFELK